MKNKIKEHYKSGFSSSPVDVNEQEIDYLIEWDCKCDGCGTSIFELDDFPEIVKNENGKCTEILCEECYDDNYRETCPICEESYDVKDFTSDHIIINEELGVETKLTPGIYEILERPFFFGDILTGFDAFFDNAIKLVVPIRINFYKKIKCGNSCCEVGSDAICPECVDELVRKGNYINSDSKLCILLKRFEGEGFFKDYSSEKLHRVRQKIIHQRISCRGLVEKGNHIDEYGKTGRLRTQRKCA